VDRALRRSMLVMAAKPHLFGIGASRTGIAERPIHLAHA